MKTPWQKFKSHKRGWISFWIFLFILFTSCSAPLICNSKPLIIVTKESILFPVFKYYPETQFSGTFDLEMDYGGKAFEKWQLKHGAYVVWPIVPYGTDTILKCQSAPPSFPTCQAILGTDEQGRDIFTRLLYGMRTSLLFALALSLLSGCIGVTAGAVQGYFGGWIDLLFQRILEIWSGLPMLFIIMIVSTLMAPSLWIIFFLMVFFSWTKLVSIVRAEFLRARNFTYVKAAQVLGVSSWSIMRRHILPNVMASSIGMLPSLFNGSLATLAALDLMGFGLPTGTASLGDLLQQAKNNLFAPWIGLTAFFSMIIVIILINFIGEGMRDAFDPTLQ